MGDGLCYVIGLIYIGLIGCKNLYMNNKGIFKCFFLVLWKKYKWFNLKKSINVNWDW